MSQSWDKHIKNNYDIRNLNFSHRQPSWSIRHTVSWLYKIMSKTEANPYKPKAWNKYITNNYDIRNRIFSYAAPLQSQQ